MEHFVFKNDNGIYSLEKICNELIECIEHDTKTNDWEEFVKDDNNEIKEIKEFMNKDQWSVEELRHFKQHHLDPWGFNDIKIIEMD